MKMATRIERGPGGSVYHYPIRIYYEDTDAGGLVYHSRYLNYAERARSELLRECGIHQAAMMRERDVAFAVRECRIDFARPALLDDWLDVRSRVLALKGASVTLDQSIWRDEEPLVTLEVRIVALRGNGRPTRLPDVLVEALSPFLASVPGARRSSDNSDALNKMN